MSTVARAKPKLTTAQLTADFRHEFEVETRQLLRRRFLWFNGLLGGLWALMCLWALYRVFIAASVDGVPTSFDWGWISADLKDAVERGAGKTGSAIRWLRLIGAPVFELVAVVTYAATFFAVKRGRVSERDLLRLTFILVVVDGTLRVIMSALGIFGGGGLWGVMFAHVLACAFLPWTPKQAIGPMLPLLGLNALITIPFGDGTWTGRLISAGFALFAAAPGLFIAWMKHSRRVESYKTAFLQRRYGELRRELVDARRIHEALFPAPNPDGPVRFTYHYEPMRQIGGDYLYATPTDGEKGRCRFSVVVLDVTGHGIPAALTVNRLHGELERVFAENRGISPGEVLRLLNRYVHLTLANHSVYVTALCIKVDETDGTLTYASGGHPPAFLRHVDGTVQQLPSTSFVLGACADADFDPEPVSVGFGPGDSFLAYTDGAIEARDAHGKMLGVQGLLKLVASLPAATPAPWSELLLQAVENHREGPPADDTLVIEVSRRV